MYNLTFYSKDFLISVTDEERTFNQPSENPDPMLGLHVTAFLEKSFNTVYLSPASLVCKVKPMFISSEGQVVLKLIHDDASVLGEL